MRKFLLLALFVMTGLVRAEGNYDPFNSKNAEERAHAEQMRIAIEKGDWVLAEKFATTDALRRLYAQAKREYAPAPAAPAKK